MVQAVTKWRQHSICMHWSVCVCECVCVLGRASEMTVSSHMANHVEQWAQMHGRESGEMWSGLENLIPLNMDAAFLKDVNLAGNLQPTPRQTDVREHTSNCIIIPPWLIHMHLLIIPLVQLTFLTFCRTFFVCILEVEIKSHPVSLTRVDTDTPSWQFNRLST